MRKQILKVGKPSPFRTSLTSQLVGTLQQFNCDSIWEYSNSYPYFHLAVAPHVKVVGHKRHSDNLLLLCGKQSLQPHVFAGNAKHKRLGNSESHKRGVPRLLSCASFYCTSIEIFTFFPSFIFATI
jgi:hypothetical protein